jgi:hypothetical protein
MSQDLKKFVALGQAMQRDIDQVLWAYAGKPEGNVVVQTEFTALVRMALERKRRIDDSNANTNNMASYDRWLVDAVELLLQIELERRGNPK